MSPSITLADKPLASCSDRPALEQLARALWRSEGPRGAALLVGAGLSRGAVLSSANIPPPPLWFDLAAAMRAELYQVDPAAAPWDPLRLAEEYRTYFGQAALDSFIRSHVRDIAWSPSETHVALLELPWSDVLTTNYDTLLERAAVVTERAYEPVRSEQEIAFAKAPRIIKLHGTIGASDHFVIAEEDFRTYPARHAAFVNLARQCFVENELCLLGFSGDDPNFLAWAGWVRDHLGSAARRIFLAGALDLSPAKRKYLEARNIAPIDLSEAVKDVASEHRHAAATRLVIDALSSLKPLFAHAWRPAPARSAAFDTDAAVQAAACDATLARWRDDRSSYPGWLVCPSGSRHDLRFATEMPRMTLLDAIDPVRVAQAMADFCWRHQAALWPIPDPYIATVRKFADPVHSAHLAPADRLLIATALLEDARRYDNEALFSEMAGLIENIAPAGSDGRSALRYQQCLKAIHKMDFGLAAALCDDIDSSDPAWQLRRASIQAALGMMPEAETTITAAVIDLRERERVDRGSLWVRSRLAWATFLQFCLSRLDSGRTSWPTRFRESRCDPWQEIESVTQAVVTAHRKRLGKPERPMPNFEPGSFREPSRTIYFGSHIEPYDELTLLLEQGGVPARLDYMSMFTGDRFEALELRHQPTLTWYCALLANGLGKADAQFNRYFGRVAIAALDETVTNGLIQRLEIARDYWLAHQDRADQVSRTFARDRLLFVLELLARLSVRLDDARATKLHLETLQLAMRPEFQNSRFAKPLTNLLGSTFEAVSPAARAVMVLPDLDLPLASDDLGPDPVEWLGTAGLQQARRNQALRAIVGRLLEAAKGERRRAAISRLTLLHFTEALTPTEARRFAKVAWARLDEGDPALPADTAVFPHFWAQLPAHGRDAPAVVAARLYGPNAPTNSSHLANMIRAVSTKAARPDTFQARELFDTIVALRFKAIDEKNFGAAFNARLNRYDPSREAHFAGAALSKVVAPCLASADRTASRLEAIERFGRETGSSAAIGAMVEFIDKHQQARISLEVAVRRGLVSRDSDQVSYAIDAVSLWLNRHGQGKHALPDTLIDQLVAVVELRQSPALWRLLDGLTEVMDSGRLNEARRTRIDTALGDLIVETHYATIDPESEAAGTISLVRREAVRLAVKLNDAGFASEHVTAWLAVARADPLPEVRHALTAPSDHSVQH